MLLLLLKSQIVILESVCLIDNIELMINKKLKYSEVFTTEFILRSQFVISKAESSKRSQFVIFEKSLSYLYKKPPHPNYIY